MTHRFVDRRTRGLASEQRRIPTAAETALWRDLRNRRLIDVKFRRQVPLGPYVADFASLEARLIVELDGPVHEDAGQLAHDARRDAWLRERGFTVLRFCNDLFASGSGELALRQIKAVLAEHRAFPSPLAGEGGLRVSEGRMRGER